ncbi:MAG: ComEC/Rec2 family competence protein [Gemmatimonadales bacterium]
MQRRHRLGFGIFSKNYPLSYAQVPYSSRAVIRRVRPLPLILLLACSGGGNSSTDPGDRTPSITVLGVADGDSLASPVTVTISVDVGTYSAELNGVTFVSGRTLTDPGDYLLTVTARNGQAVATLELRFTILLGGETRLIVRVLNLGENEAGGGGDAILLTDSSSAGMRHVIVDAGPAGVGASDPGFVARRLQQLGVDTLEAMILTHAHTDHFGGMSAILSEIFVRRFFYNGQIRNLSSYSTTITLAGQRAGTVIIPTNVNSLTLGFGTSPTELAVLPPFATFLGNSNADGSQINEGSLGTAVQKGTFRMFLTGDSEVAANLRWRTQFSQLTQALTVLKVGHHGANDATFDNGFNGNSAWLTHTAPQIAVISANGVTHPRLNATAKFLSLATTRTYCTNVHGDIEIRVSEIGTFQVTVERNANANCVAGRDAST